MSWTSYGLLIHKPDWLVIDTIAYQLYIRRNALFYVYPREGVLMSIYWPFWATLANVLAI